MRGKINNLGKYNAQRHKDTNTYLSKGYRPNGKRRFWTPEELDMIMHSDCTDIELSHRIGRTLGAIQTRRSILKADNFK